MFIHKDTMTPHSSDTVKAVPLENHTILKAGNGEYYELIDNIFYKTKLNIVEHHEELMIYPRQFSKTEEGYTAEQLIDKYKGNLNLSIEKLGGINKWQF